MMGVVHDALCRDLARLQSALPGSPYTAKHSGERSPGTTTERWISCNVKNKARTTARDS